MYEVGKSRLNSIAHYWHKLDNLSSTSDKLCWCYNSHNLRENNLRSKVSKETMAFDLCNSWRSGMCELGK